ncbi:MAG: FliM/FliN family flagellar motor switch protein [Nevskia sp.]|jgi:hypothetical protein|nr:FliM/FliN family flagellar motor switch protein [Nevskia sp.]MCK9383359.1 FliM/FliN family flagellar motor switch protein [Nevskia sp.]
MDARAYLLLSESHLLDLRKRFAAALSTWNERWLNADGVFLSLTELARHVPGSDVGGHWALEDGERCYVQAVLDKTASFETLFYRFIDPAAQARRPGMTSAVATATAQALLADLVMTFIGEQDKSRLSPVWRRVSGPTDHDALGYGAVAASISAGDVVIGLYFSGVVVGNLLPRAIKKKGPALVKPLQAVATAPVKLRVCLEASQGLMLSELENLSVGDIVLLDREPGEAWMLTGPDGVAVAACAPGRVDSYYAVHVLGRN